MRICLSLIFLLITTSSYAASFEGKFIQGSFILGKTEPNAAVFIDDTKVIVTNDGYFAFGLDRDRKNDVVITINKKKIVKKVFKRENKWIGEARAINSNLVFFKNKFIKPLEKAIVTGVYGSQRILNGKPKWPHYGIDFAAEEGTKIKAMLDGVVTLAEPDLFYTGGTLIFDHGHGISTLYMHMKTLMVKKDQKVKQGDVIGTVGSTGRSTGAHLDVRLNWFQTRLDPATVLDIQ